MGQRRSLLWSSGKVQTGARTFHRVRSALEAFLGNHVGHLAGRPAFGTGALEDLHEVVVDLLDVAGDLLVLEAGALMIDVDDAAALILYSPAR